MGGTIDSFHVYRDNVLVRDNVTGDTVFVDQLITGTHHYFVRSFDTVCGESDSSNGDNGFGYTPLTPPSGLVSDSSTCDSLHLCWNAVPGATAYVLYRNGTEITRTTALCYWDARANSGSQQSYTVAAYEPHCGASQPSFITYANLQPLVVQGPPCRFRVAW